MSPTRPRIAIHYCPRCRWLLRAAWYAQELLSTFEDALGEVEVLPPPSGHYEPGTPAGLAEAVSFIHAADAQMNATPGCTTIRLHALRGLLGWLDPRRKPILVQLPGGLPR